MDTIECDEQDLFVVNFSRNIYDITGEQDNDIDNFDNFEEIQNEMNIRGGGGNRSRGRGRRW